ncbi:MAG: hypothetical protein GXO76_00435 [Calditrichaeota bacterium]|nr:hypothetical protein [Calditrichota bacterium]
MKFEVLMKRASAWMILVIAASFWVGCSSTNKQNKKDAVVARVGKSVLLASEINQEIPGALSKSIRLDEKKNYVRRWINTEVLYQEARKRGYDHLPDIQRELQSVKKALLANKLLEKEFPEKPVIPDSTIRGYYLRHKDSFVRNRNEIRLGIVLFQQKKGAKAFVNLLRSGKSFGQAMKVTFPKKEQSQAWDTGYIPKTDIPSALSGVVKRTKIKGIVGPLKTADGYYVFQVLDRQKSGSYRSFEEVRAKIVALLQEEKIREIYHQYINSLKNQQNIVMNLNVLNETQSDSTGL